MKGEEFTFSLKKGEVENVKKIISNSTQRMPKSCGITSQPSPAQPSTSDYSAALIAATVGLNDASTLPSARVLAAMAKDHDNSFVKFVRAQSEKAKANLQALPFSNEQQTHFKSLSQQSIADQKKIEALDSMPFEMYREQYVSAIRLNVSEKTEKEPVLIG